MKHAAVITVSNRRGSRDFVLSVQTQYWLKGLCLALLGVILAIVAVISLALSSLSEARTQVTALLEEKRIYFRQLDELQLALDERSAALQKAEQSIEQNTLARPANTVTVVTSAPETNQLDERAWLLSFVPNGAPIKKAVQIHSGFGSRTHPILHVRRHHQGVDIVAQSGTPVYATADGVVAKAIVQSRTGYGRQVLIKHAFGFSSRYAHLSEVSVKLGDHLHKGDLLGQSGNSGRSSGPHLHYEVRYLNKALDPVRFVRWSTNNFDPLFTLEKGVPWTSLKKPKRPPTQLAGLPLSPKVAP